MTEEYKKIEEYHEKEGVEVQALVQFTTTARAVLKFIDSYLYRKARLSLVKFIVLQALLFKDKAVSLTDLAIVTNTERHNITTLIERLRKDGLVTTRRSKVDRRVINVELTDKGAELVNKAFPISRDMAAQIITADNHAELDAFLKQLGLMCANASAGLNKN
jgi:DNA-binding MarR family transcriptional regulator